MNENEPKETDSMDDLRQVKSDPFSFWDGLKRWIFRDSFRSIQLSVVLASVLLTIALIFDSQLGAGPIAQHGAGKICCFLNNSFFFLKHIWIIFTVKFSFFFLCKSVRTL